MTLGWAYLSSLNLWETAQPLMEELTKQTNESCSAATLDLPDVVYVARVPTHRIMTIALGIGTRLPAHCTSMGRVLLAELPETELEEFLATARLEGYTDAHDHRARAACVARSRRCATQGWALVDQELEIGLRSIAAPLRVEGRTIAAVNVSAAAPRVPLEQLRGAFLPELLKTVGLDRDGPRAPAPPGAPGARAGAGSRRARAPSHRPDRTA